MSWLDRIAPIPQHSGHRPFQQGVINPWRVIFDFELFMFKDGNARFIINNNELYCPDPYFVIIPPGIRHISYCLTKQVTVYWSHFDWIWQDRTPDRVSYDLEKAEKRTVNIPEFVPNQLFHGPVRNSQIFTIHETMCRYANSSVAREKRLARSYYLQELLYLLDDTNDLPAVADHEEQIAMNARNCLDQLAREPMNSMRTVKDALSELGQSYFHQERIFKKRFHITPYQYLTAIRVEHIKELLGNSSYRISDIAYQLGFDDIAYFSRYFSKHCGMSPRKYRQQKC